jgi:hypothetical protein
MSRRRNLSKRAWGILGVAAAAVGGLFVYNKMKEARARGPVPAPPPVRPGQVIPDIAYERGGESHLTLPVGSVFRVVWDPLSETNYAVQETSSTELVASGDGFARFRQSIALPVGAVSQVFVIESDDSDNVLGEHKVTVHGF